MEKQTKPAAWQYFKGRNFLTPKVLKQAWAGPYVYELSTGSGMFGSDDMYGVTVLKPKGAAFSAERIDDLSDCFFSKEDALRHIEKIKAMEA